VALYAQDADDSSDPRLHFIVFFGRNLLRPRYVEARSLADHRLGYPISALTEQWIHIAGVWDRQRFAVEELKVWNYARTDYSTRR
jgi:hypothetical protein